MTDAREEALRTALIRAAFVAEEMFEKIPRRHRDPEILAEIQTWKQIANDIEEEAT